ncbi:uncharacterized protein B0P05DRAFT_562857 [Gilbertella persicaria]|uniref:uncharacterized protein n=1 Tax=Gilbertella persicaria TaxID=101096 RepID=UPI00221EC226|nr:uncharacterized protein B0P05DRAFT_562857 [Gilbertella persicaria]KAI8051073.1 hypothetical protein B0P05DRAFT_562857 [Gilbertella persicaria]
MVNKSTLFPPFYSVDQFTWSTPFVIGPTILLTTLLVFGIPRYLNNHHFNNTVTLHRHLTAFSKFLVCLCFIVAITWIADAAVIVTRAILEHYWTSSVLAFYTGISWLAWALSLFTLADETQHYGKWYWTQYLFWVLAVASDTVVGWLWIMGITRPEPGTEFTLYDHFLLGIFIVRYIVEVIIVLLSIAHLFSTNHNTLDEASPLLGQQQQENYGTKTNNEPSPFSGFMEKMKKLLPFIWPHHNLKLQLYVVLCFVIMIFGFIVNLLAPRQIGQIVDNLKEGQFPWIPILFYIGLKFLQGGSGLLQALQNWLWIPIGQYTTREISLKTFSHLHSLSLGFHISRKTGEVLRVMDRGTSSVVSLLNQILFQIFPVWANIILISFFTTYVYAPSFGLIVFLTMAMYMYVTVAVTEWRTKYRRRMIELDNYARTKAVDSLLNFETVKYYNAENFEINRYKDAILEYQEADWKSSVSLNVLNLAQNAIITGGLLSGCLLFAYEVSSGDLSAGDFVAFNMYMMQLYTPLHWFGTYYRMIQSNFIDMEKMLELLDQVQTVQDAPDAEELVVTEGHVVFDNVTFSYDGRQTALDGVSFTIPKGATVALVGPSGGGKSTILRLLFRFYDPDAGRVFIDGQDIRQVTQLSLRKNIGVVPQDTVLFNDTIYYNIQYGDVNAEDSQIKRAAKAAQIHDKIETFPDGYDTKVGERGLRLSGGEKQRVAIARTILKNPPIILLDEATSALDTTTERHIQQALSDMTKDRTTLVIAHRLSTIVNADLILVIKDGKVVESGSHEELIKKATQQGQGGIYYEMWQKQLHDENDTLNDHSTDEENTKSREIDTQIIELENPVETKVATSSPTEVEVIELDEEEEEEQQQKKEQSSTDADNNNCSTPSSSTANSTNKKKKKRKSRNRTKSKF